MWLRYNHYYNKIITSKKCKDFLSSKTFLHVLRSHIKFRKSAFLGNIFVLNIPPKPHVARVLMAEKHQTTTNFSGVIEHYFLIKNRLCNCLYLPKHSQLLQNLLKALMFHDFADIYTYIHTVHTRTHTHTDIHSYIHTYIHAYIYTNMHTKYH